MFLELTVIGGTSYVVRRVRRRPRLIEKLVPNQRSDWTSLKRQTEVKSMEEHKANKYFLDNSIVLGSAVIGLAFSPVLSPMSLYLLIPGILYYGAYPLLQDAWRDLREERRLTAAGLDVILLVLTMIYSVVNPRVLVVAVFSNWMYALFLKVTARNKSHAQSRMSQLAMAAPEQVWVLVDGVEMAVDFTQLKMGDVLILKAGQYVPVDGTVRNASVLVNQRLLTGDAVPVRKQVGEAVLAGSVLHAGCLHLQVDKLGAATVLAELRYLFNTTAIYAAGTEPRGKVLADRFALTGVGLGALAYPLGGLNASLAVIMMSPCYNMRLFGALTVMDFLEAAAQDGILIKDGRVLEQLDKIDTLVFDVAALLVINTDGKKTLLPGTLECMTALRAQGMKLWLVSVEPETLTAGWAGQLGVETYVSDAMPQDKVDLVQHLRAEGSFVAYVGDGIGDAVPMRLAQIAISINGINALVQDTAQLILLDQNLQHLSGLLALSQRFEASMKRSAWLTTVPNMVSIGGTFLGLVGYATAIGIFFAVLGGGMLNVFGSTLRRQAAHPTASAPIPPILHVCPTTEESS